MILDFTVQNFLSFKDEQTISFEATSDKSYIDTFTTKIGKTRLLKFSVIYGANASGKSNLLDAINFLRFLQISPPNNKSATTKFIPFLLDKENKDKAGNFSIRFFIEETKYAYSIRLTEKLVLWEKLEYYPGTQPALLFERKYNSAKNISEIKYGDKLRLSKEDEVYLTKSTINNATVLGTFTKSNIHSKQLDKIYQWFSNGMMKIIKTGTKLFNWTSERIKNNQNYKAFLLDILNKADFNISDITFEKKQGIISKGKIAPEQVKFSHEVEDTIDILYEISKFFYSFAKTK